MLILLQQVKGDRVWKEGGSVNIRRWLPTRPSMGIVSAACVCNVVDPNPSHAFNPQRSCATQ